MRNPNRTMKHLRNAPSKLALRPAPLKLRVERLEHRLMLTGDPGGSVEETIVESATSSNFIVPSIVVHEGSAVVAAGLFDWDGLVMGAGSLRPDHYSGPSGIAPSWAAGDLAEFVVTASDSDISYVLPSTTTTTEAAGWTRTVTESYDVRVVLSGTYNPDGTWSYSEVVTAAFSYDEQATNGSSQHIFQHSGNFVSSLTASGDDVSANYLLTVTGSAHDYASVNDGPGGVVPGPELISIDSTISSFTNSHSISVSKDPFDGSYTADHTQTRDASQTVVVTSSSSDATTGSSGTIAASLADQTQEASLNEMSASSTSSETTVTTWDVDANIIRTKDGFGSYESDGQVTITGDYFGTSTADFSKQIVEKTRSVESPLTTGVDIDVESISDVDISFSGTTTRQYSRTADHLEQIVSSASSQNATDEVTSLTTDFWEGILESSSHQSLGGTMNATADLSFTDTMSHTESISEDLDVVSTHTSSLSPGDDTPTNWGSSQTILTFSSTTESSNLTAYNDSGDATASGVGDGMSFTGLVATSGHTTSSTTTNRVVSSTTAETLLATGETTTVTISTGSSDFETTGTRQQSESRSQSESRAVAGYSMADSSSATATHATTFSNSGSIDSASDITVARVLMPGSSSEFDTEVTGSATATSTGDSSNSTSTSGSEAAQLASADGTDSEAKNANRSWTGNSDGAESFVRTVSKSFNADDSIVEHAIGNRSNSINVLNSVSEASGSLVNASSTWGVVYSSTLSDHFSESHDWSNSFSSTVTSETDVIVTHLPKYVPGKQEPDSYDQEVSGTHDQNTVQNTSDVVDSLVGGHIYGYDLATSLKTENIDLGHSWSASSQKSTSMDLNKDLTFTAGADTTQHVYGAVSADESSTRTDIIDYDHFTHSFLSLGFSDHTETIDLNMTEGGSHSWSVMPDYTVSFDSSTDGVAASDAGNMPDPNPDETGTVSANGPEITGVTGQIVRVSQSTILLNFVDDRGDARSGSASNAVGSYVLSNGNNVVVTNDGSKTKSTTATLTFLPDGGWSETATHTNATNNLWQETNNGTISVVTIVAGLTVGDSATFGSTTSRMTNFHRTDNTTRSKTASDDEVTGSGTFTTTIVDVSGTSSASGGGTKSLSIEAGQVEDVQYDANGTPTNSPYYEFWSESIGWTYAAGDHHAVTPGDYTGSLAYSEQSGWAVVPGSEPEFINQQWGTEDESFTTTTTHRKLEMDEWVIDDSSVVSSTHPQLTYNTTSSSFDFNQNGYDSENYEGIASITNSEPPLEKPDTDFLTELPQPDPADTGPTPNQTSVQSADHTIVVGAGEWLVDIANRNRKKLLSFHHTMTDVHQWADDYATEMELTDAAHMMLMYAQDTTSLSIGFAPIYVQDISMNEFYSDGSGSVRRFDLLTAADSFAAGFANTLTFGYSNQWREDLYGEIATANHQGGWYLAGSIFGSVVQVGLGFGGGGGLLSTAARIYSIVDDVVGVYQSTMAVASGNFTALDVVGFLPLAPAASAAARRARGPCGGYVFRRCFVGDTQVVVGTDESIPTQIVETSDSNGSGFLAAGSMFIVIGVAGAVVLEMNHRRRREEKLKNDAWDELFSEPDGVGPVEEETASPLPKIGEVELEELCDRLFDVIDMGEAATACHFERTGEPDDISSFSPHRPLSLSPLDAPSGVIGESESDLSVQSPSTATLLKPDGRMRRRTSRVRTSSKAGSSLKPNRLPALSWVISALLLAGCCFWRGSSAPDRRPQALPSATPVYATPVYATKAIKEIKPGDIVLARDEHGRDLGYKPVVEVYRRTSDHLRILRLVARNGSSQTLKTTNEHPFWVAQKQRFVDAGDLEVGDQVVGPRGEPQQVTSTVLERHSEGVAVFNFQVADYHTYYVKALGARAPPVLVHNADYDGPSARVVHEQYLQQVRAGAREKVFDTPWSSSTGLGTRKVDDYDPLTKTIYEANTTPWSSMTERKLSHKLDQVGSDYTLRLTDPRVERVVWFGTEQLPTTGLGGQLREALEQAGIEYWVVVP